MASGYYPVLDRYLSAVGTLRVGPNGELIVEPEGGVYAGELDASAAAELAIEILKRARPMHRLFEVQEIKNVVHSLEEILDE